MIVVFGSLNVDVMIGVTRLPAPGETVLGPGYALTAGGKGGNQALAAARAGASVVMLGAIGDDPLTETAVADLRAAGVDLSHLEHVTEPTGLAAICVDPAGENQIVVASGANRFARAGSVPAELLTPQTIVVLQMETPPEENWALVRTAKAAGARILLNAAPAAGIPVGVLRQIDWLIVNESEAIEVAGHLGLAESDARRAIAAIAAQTGVTAIVTLGGAGAMAQVGPNNDILVPALPIKPLDTVGAGDSFVGGFAAAMDRGNNLTTALRYASVGGGLACLRTGAQPSLPTLAEIEQMLAQLP